MPVYKDTERGSWYCQFYYEDWTGKRKKKYKRGFRTKKEAQDFESEFKRIASTDMDMTVASFVDVYFADKSGELKERSMRNKKYMIDSHVIPYLGEKKMNEVAPADIIAWQNEIRSKNFSESYQRMLQNQVTALFTHAQRIYNLSNNPCKKVKKIGRSDVRRLEFWTYEEYQKFIATFEKGTRSYLMFEILFWTGMREGDADGKISLNQQKPSKHAGLRRFGPEKFLQRNNEFMKERPIFYKKPIKTEKDFSTWLRCFYYTTKAVITEYIYF